MSRLLLVLLLGLLPGLSTAQVNTERMRLDDDVTGLNLSVSLQGAYAEGNTDYYDIRAGGRIDYRREGDAAFLVGNYAFSEVEGANFIDRAFAHLRYNNSITKRIVGEMFVQTERNEQQLLARRYLLGGGVRLEAIETEEFDAALGVTPMFEFERLRIATEETTVDDFDRVFRLSSYLSVSLDLSDRVSLHSTVYAQPVLNDFDDYRVLNESHLNLGITKYLKFRSSLIYRYDSEPPPTIDRADFSILNGIVVTYPVE